MAPIDTLTLPKGTKIPNHIALILDGNRRWARSRGLHPWEGHKAGFFALKALAKSARTLGVHTFTVWGFSTENWDRPQQEIEKIMGLILRALKDMEKEIIKDQVRFVHLGRKDRLPENVLKKIQE
ncbi:MAG: polyprenyl diphosphate synthase, partial [Patescibacteria group bacterium]